jgi:hypothetical protein
MTSKLWPLSVALLLASCGSKNEDQVDTVDRSGSVETSVSIQHADSTHDVILTTHKVWVDFKQYATVEHRDTVPALGMLSTVAENDDGDTQKVRVKKDYQLFITVK